MSDVNVVIQNETDWNCFKSEKLDTIVDPMVFRSADVFLRGKKGTQESMPGKEPDEIWQALSANVGSLTAFFDALILSDYLPIIDYGVTFDPNVGFDTFYLYNRINETAQDTVLVSVHVMAEAYHQSKKAALSVLKKTGQIPRELAQSILEELSAFDYAWAPDLSALGQISEDDQVLARFMFGGLLFSAYAQQTGAGHLLQPKRSRLYLAASLGADSAAYRYEQTLFDELKKISTDEASMRGSTYEFHGLPSFLPYLLSRNPDTPEALLRSALELKKSDEVNEYREWRTRLLRDWRDKGEVAPQREQEIRRITQAVLRRIHVPGEPSIGLSVSFSGVNASTQLPIQRLLGWIMSQLPGRRYSKLLMRMMLANHEYRHIERHLRTIWKSG